METSFNGNFVAQAWRCDSCKRSPVQYDKVDDTSKVTLVENNQLLDEQVGDGRATVVQQVIDTEKVRSGQLRTNRMTVQHAMYDAGRYNIGFSLGRGPVDTKNDTARVDSLSGQVGHDRSLPIVDIMSIEGAEVDGIAAYLEAYQVGISELQNLHREAGRDELAGIYEEVKGGFSAFRSALPGSELSWAPETNALALTSDPEFLAQVDLKNALPNAEVSAQCGCGLGCCCGCGSCLGCGCGAGLCIASPPPCSCGWCTGCSCGCGYCCGCDAC